MDAVLDETWRDIFERAARLRAEKVRKAQRDADLERLDEDKRKKAEAEKEDRQELEQLQVLVATSAEMIAFQAELDDYDTKTVNALMMNGEALDRVRHDLDEMLYLAFVLPDGRRVFKTEDGRRVFDEHGAEVSAKVVDPNAIPERLPSWEAFKAQTDEQVRLQGERHDLLDFQAKLDRARERVGKGDMSKKDLDNLGANLAASAPSSVRRANAMSLRKDAPDRALADRALSPADSPRRLGDLSGRPGTIPAPM